MTTLYSILAQVGPALEPARSKSLDYALLTGLVLLLAGAVAVGLRDMLRLSWTRLWALAALTFRESIRRRVLLLIPGAMAAIVAIGAFQRSFDEVGQIHQLTATCIRVASGLTLLLMILLSAFAFPREIESRTIYSLLTKPVSRLEVFLGKVLGLWLVALSVMAIMGAFSYGYLQLRESQLSYQARQRLANQPKDVEPVLQQHLKMGLLTAANYIDAPVPQVHPIVPYEYSELPRKWMITGRGYLGLYSIKVPPLTERAARYELRLRLDIPQAGSLDKIMPVVRLFVPSLTSDNKVPAWQPPRAVELAGWTAGLWKPLEFEHFHLSPDGKVWEGAVDLEPGLLLAMGQLTTQLAFSVDVNSQTPRLAGLIQPLPAEAPRAVHGLELVPVLVEKTADTPAQYGKPIRPEKLSLFPRAQATARFSVAGSPESGPIEVAEYVFNDIPLKDLPDGDVVVRLRINVDQNDSRAVITAYPSFGKPAHLSAAVSKRLGAYVVVPRKIVEAGLLKLQIRPQRMDDVFVLSADSVRLVTKPTGFAPNLVKSLLICQVQAMIVVALGVMASVFLSWPVALLLTSVLLIAGNLLDMVRGMLANPGGFSVFAVTGEDKSIDFASQAGNEFFKQSSRLVERIVPDFTRFDPVGFIGQGLNTPWATIGSNATWALIYIGVAMAIGYLALHFKEVAK